MKLLTDQRHGARIASTVVYDYSKPYFVHVTLCIQIVPALKFVVVDPLAGVREAERHMLS